MEAMSKYFSAATCSMFDGTQITARDKGISAVRASAIMI